MESNDPNFCVIISKYLIISLLIWSLCSLISSNSSFVLSSMSSLLLIYSFLVIGFGYTNTSYTLFVSSGENIISLIISFIKKKIFSL